MGTVVPLSARGRLSLSASVGVESPAGDRKGASQGIARWPRERSLVLMRRVALLSVFWFFACGGHNSGAPDAGNGGPPDGGDSTCGDGIVSGIEACDDGNAVSGDGCSATCQLE